MQCTFSANESNNNKNTIACKSMIHWKKTCTWEILDPFQQQEYLLGLENQFGIRLKCSNYAINQIPTQMF